MSPVIALAFLCGMIALLTGAARGITALRAAVTTRVPVEGTGDPEVVVRHWLPSLAWGSVALYGLVLASAGMLLAR